MKCVVLKVVTEVIHLYKEMDILDGISFLSRTEAEKKEL